MSGIISYCPPRSSLKLTLFLFHNTKYQLLSLRIFILLSFLRLYMINKISDTLINRKSNMAQVLSYKLFIIYTEKPQNVSYIYNDNLLKYSEFI